MQASKYAESKDTTKCEVEERYRTPTLKTSSYCSAVAKIHPGLSTTSSPSLSRLLLMKCKYCHASPTLSPLSASALFKGHQTFSSSASSHSPPQPGIPHSS